MRRVLGLACAIFLVGCASPYAKFYQPNPNAPLDKVTANRAGPPPVEPSLDHTALVGDELVDAYSAQGYFVIGHSSFNGGRAAADTDAIAQGKKVGADLVVISSPRYTGTRSSVIPIVTPTTSTSYTTGSATAFGSGGSATAYGSATTTTYGSRTNYVPISTDRYDFLAVYMVKIRARVGAVVKNLSDAQKQLMQSNHGVVVTGIMNGSPAFDADLLVGDILLSVDGETIGDADSYGEILKNHSGQTCKFQIYRNGKVIDKQVSIR